MTRAAHRVFVYGTLKRGFPNYSPFMDRAAFVGAYRTVEAYPLVIGGRWFVPYLLDEPGEGHRVAGEVYTVDAAVLAGLDRLEGTHLPEGYRRVAIAVVPLAGGEPHEAWTYLKDRAGIEPIHEGPLGEYPPNPRYVHWSKRPKEP